MGAGKQIGWTVGARVWIRDGGACSYCGRALSLYPGEGLSATIDHVTPVCRGGPTALWNLALSCGSCNSVKENGRVRPDRIRAVRDRLAALYPDREQSPRLVPRDPVKGHPRSTSALARTARGGGALRDLRVALEALAQFQDEWTA